MKWSVVLAAATVQLHLAGTHAAHVSAQPAAISAGVWVKVAFGGVDVSELRRPTSEYLCVQDSVCEDVQNMSLWVGVFPSGADRRPIGPQNWGTAMAPWLATSPLKWKPLQAAEGEVDFRMGASHSAFVEFVLFSNGTTWPIELAASRPVKFLDYSAPKHVRLARVADHVSMRVTWSSTVRDESASVEWGTAPGSYSHSQKAKSSTYEKKDLCGPPATTQGWLPLPLFYSALVGPLDILHAQAIYYRVGSDATGWSEEASFIPPQQGGSSSRLRVIALADVGETEADGSQYHWMEPFAGNTTTFAWGWHGAPQGHVLRALREHTQDAQAVGFDLVLHVGDLSYATGYASKWDQFLQQIEPLSSRVPYMVALGNHERDWPGSGSAIGGYDSGGECGVPTQARFPSPGSGPGEKGYWYSFDQGPVHFVMMNTELSASAGSPQWHFLASDLAAVDRLKTPWVVLSGHRPMYSAWDAMQKPGGKNASYDWDDGHWWPDVEALLVKYQVDLCLWGHVHNAEQTCPLIKGKCVQPSTPGGYDAPVHAVIGNGGQSLSPYCLPGTSCCCASRGPRCAEACEALPRWSRWRMDGFGYASLVVEGPRELMVSFYEDCVGERQGLTMRTCREYNKFAHAFTIRRGGGRGASLAPEGGAAEIVV